MILEANAIPLNTSVYILHALSHKEPTMNRVEIPDLTTLHVHADEVPWVSQPGLASGDIRGRVLHAPEDGSFVVTQLQVGPGVLSGLHRHIGPTFAYTSKGSWGHDTTYRYHPGTYVFETPGVVHRFHSGDEATTEVLFVNYATLEFIDSDSMEVIGSMTPFDIAQKYFEDCEAAGVPRPNILG
jgi:2,4'-dihydroxyacetophenone dioxygenase